MKPALVDTDILSEFLRGNSRVVENTEKYLQSFDAINFSIITYYEILNGLLYKGKHILITNSKGMTPPTTC